MAEPIFVTSRRSAGWGCAFWSPRARADDFSSPSAAPLASASGNRTRPDTAAAAPENKDKVSQRPMTAAIEDTRKKVCIYTAALQMRCSSSERRRPISAALNSRFARQKQQPRLIDPARTRRVYMRYLKELEEEAQQFVRLEETKQQPQRQTKARRKWRTRGRIVKIALKTAPGAASKAYLVL